MIPLPDLSAWARWVMRGAIVFLVGWGLVEYGAARQGDLSMHTLSNAMACTLLLDETLGQAERAAGAARSANEAMVALLGVR